MTETVQLYNRVELNSEQAEIIKFAEQGHNLLITGQAGVGKSEVVKRIIQYAKDHDIKVAVIASSGIACQVYETGVAKTVHSWYGLLTADLPWKQVIDRAAEDGNVKTRVQSAEIIIWDEASMSSQRMLELVNSLHHQLSLDDENCRHHPFAGKQYIFVGEFLQLQPVPNAFDEGNFMFRSQVFADTISHRFELTKVMRQSDELFLFAISEIRLGNCSKRTEEFLAGLSRELTWVIERDATHIFFRKIPAILFNQGIISQLPGELIHLEATFENDLSENMNFPGYQCLQIKPNCKVMLVWNISDELRNGSIGIFKEFRNDILLVLFEEVGVIEISRQTWIKRNRSGERIGSVTQFPIIPAYAVTCHKSQGLTLPSAVIHCSREYVPGLIYVAISRVKSPEHLQVLNFKPDQLLKPATEVIEQCSTQHTCAAVQDLSCCRKKMVNDESFIVHDRFSECAVEGEDQFSFPMDMFNGPVRAQFEEDRVPMPLQLTEVYEKLIQNESHLATPTPACFQKCREYLVSLKKEHSLSPFMDNKNAAIDHLLDDSLDLQLKAFIRIMWYHAFIIIHDHVVENADDVVGVNLSRQYFTEATSQIHALFNSEDFHGYVCVIFGTKEFTPFQRAIAVQLSLQIYWDFLRHLETLIVAQRETDEVQFNVEDMGGAGRSKVRHVGGWTVRKILSRYRKYVQRNIFSSRNTTLSQVHMNQQLCQLLEENVVVPYAKLEEESKYPETLEVTEGRQYRERGLLHISDQAYLFFMQLEERRVQLLNLQRLKQEKENMVVTAMSELTGDESLQLCWRECFGTKDVKENTVRFISNR